MLSGLSLNLCVIAQKFFFSFFFFLFTTFWFDTSISLSLATILENVQGRQGPFLVLVCIVLCSSSRGRLGSVGSYWSLGMPHENFVIDVFCIFAVTTYLVAVLSLLHCTYCCCYCYVCYYCCYSCCGYLTILLETKIVQQCCCWNYMQWKKTILIQLFLGYFWFNKLLFFGPMLLL